MVTSSPGAGKSSPPFIISGGWDVQIVFLCSLLLQLASAIGYVIGCLILKFSVKIDNVAFVYDKINQVNKVENRTEFVVLKMIKYSTCACILNLLSHSLCKGGPLCSSIVDHHWLLSNSFELSAKFCFF